MERPPAEWPGGNPSWCLGARRRLGLPRTEDPHGCANGVKALYNVDRGVPAYVNRKHFDPQYSQELAARRLRAAVPEVDRHDRPEGKRPIEMHVSNTPRVEGQRMFAPVLRTTEATIESRLCRKAVALDPRTGRPRSLTEATEYAFPEGSMGMHVKVPEGPARRNGIPVVHGGDKAYGASDYAPDFFMSSEAAETQKLSRLAISWFRSAQNPYVDKTGRSINEYIQLYCITPWRKLSMYAFKDAQVSEVITNCGDGVDGSVLMFNGTVLNPQGHLREYGIKRNSVLVLVNPKDKGEERLNYSQQEAARMHAAEASEVQTLDDWKPVEEKPPEPPPPVDAKAKAPGKK